MNYDKFVVHLPSYFDVLSLDSIQHTINKKDVQHLKR